MDDYTRLPRVQMIITQMHLRAQVYKTLTDRYFSSILAKICLEVLYVYKLQSIVDRLDTYNFYKALQRLTLRPRIEIIQYHHQLRARRMRT